MLQAMRSGSKSPVMKVFLVFLAGGFALWGVGDVTTGLIGGSDKAISAGDESVSPAQVAYEFDRTRRNYLPDATTGEALQAGLLNELVGVLSRDVVFRAEANEIGLTVTRTMQRQAVAQEAAFQDESGTFSEGRFLQTLANAGLSEETYLSQIDTQLRREQLTNALSAGVQQSESVSATLAAYELEKRTAKMISVAVTPETIAAPDDATLAAFYNDTKSSYDAPVLRSARVGTLSPTMLLDQIDIDEADIKDAFDLRIDEFTTPETRAVRQMVFDDETTATTAFERVQAGEAFNDVANDMLGWTADDVNLGTLTRQALDDSLASAAFGAIAGDVTAPVQSLFGFHVLLIDEVNAGSNAAYDDVRGQIEATLKLEAAIDRIYDSVADMEDRVASGATLDEAINAAGGSAITLTDISRRGTDIDNAPLSGDAGALATDSIVLDLVWNGDIDELSVIQEGNDDTFYLVEVTDEKESRERDLSEVKTRVIADWQRGEAIAAAREEATAIAADPAQFEAIEATEAFRRNGLGLDHAAARLIANTVFAVDSGATDIVETGAEAIAVMAVDVIAADSEELANTTDLVNGVIQNAVRQDIVNILALQLSQKHNLSFNLAPVQQLLIGSSAQ